MKVSDIPKREALKGRGGMLWNFQVGVERRDAMCRHRDVNWAELLRRRIDEALAALGETTAFPAVRASKQDVPRQDK